jgi:hypothetical protein
MTWDEVFRDPRYLLFWDNIFWPRVPRQKREDYGVHSALGWRDLLKEKFYDPFVKDEPPVTADSSRSRVVFWRRELPSEQVLDQLREPTRPEVDLG